MKKTLENNISKENVQYINSTLETTLKKLFEQQISYERKLREQAENQANEYKQKLQDCEQRLDNTLNQMNKLTDTIKLLEAPKQKENKKRKFWFF